MKVQGALSSVIDPVLNPLRSIIPPTLGSPKLRCAKVTLQELEVNTWPLQGWVASISPS